MTYTAEQQRERYYANLEENRRKHREYARANRDKYNAARRKRRAENPEQVRAYEREQKRGRPKGSPRMDNHADWTPEADATMRQEQDGLCYLCGTKLSSGKTDIDHDHTCCPKGKSCRVCRRGIAHHRCNVIIGLATDDPAMLRRIADALEAAQAAFVRRRDEAGNRNGEQLVLSSIDD